MKNDIHPKYHEKLTVTCSCGAVLTTGATQENIDTEICSSCHPLYTGKKKTLDSTGRVDRFKKMAQKAEEKKNLAKKREEDKQKKEQVTAKEASQKTEKETPKETSDSEK